MAGSTMNLRKASPGNKLTDYSNKLSSVKSKGNLQKVSSKTNKPYFPPINASKPSLKLN